MKVELYLGIHCVTYGTSGECFQISKESCVSNAPYSFAIINSFEIELYTLLP